jgi:glucokinase
LNGMGTISFSHSSRPFHIECYREALLEPFRSEFSAWICRNGNATIREVRLTSVAGKAVLVYDVGGSHVSAAVCREDGYELGQVAHARHPEEQSSDAFVGVLQALGVEACEGFDGVLGAEIAMPGPFDYAAGISQMTHKLPYLLGVDLRRALAERAGWKPASIRFLKDADAYLLGEIGAGAARGAKRAVCLTLGTGVGSGFGVDGHAVKEGPNVPPCGEIWNLPYEGGILEDAISTRALQADYKNRTGELREVAAIAADAENDPAAAEVFFEFGRHLGVALRTVLVPFAPDVVVVGGGISRSSHLFLPAAQSELRGLSFELRVSTLLDNAPLVGAGVAWFDEESRS